MDASPPAHDCISNGYDRLLQPANLIVIIIIRILNTVERVY